MKLNKTKAVYLAMVVCGITLSGFNCTKNNDSSSDSPKKQTNDTTPPKISQSPSGAGSFLASNESYTIIFDESVDPGTLTLSFAGLTPTSGLTVSWAMTNSPNDTLVITGNFPAGLQTLDLTVNDTSGNPVTYTENRTVVTAVGGTAFFYVKPAADGGDDAADGLTPATAKATIQAAINAASAGNNVFVAQGYYMVSAYDPVNPHVSMKKDVSIYGGFSLDFKQRSPRVNETIIEDTCTSNYSNGQRCNAVELADPTMDANTIIDGFTIRGSAGTTGGPGILSAVYGNVGGSATIQNNIIYSGGSAITGVWNELYAIDLRPFTGVIRNNIIIVEENGVTGAKGGAIIYDSNGVDYLFENNTIISITNKAVIQNYGIKLAGGGTTKTGILQNNIFYTSGGSTIRTVFELDGKSTPKSFKNNLVSSVYIIYDAVNLKWIPINLATLNGRTGNSGNINDQPVFVDIATNNYHLDPTSPANVREGGLDLSGTSTTDADGNPRTATINSSPTNTGASGWSVGAYEQD